MYVLCMCVLGGVEGGGVWALSIYAICKNGRGSGGIMHYIVCTINPTTLSHDILKCEVIRLPF